MNLAQIRDMPTLLEVDGVTYHESLFRSYQIVSKVVDILNGGPVDQKLLAELIEDMRNSPSAKYGATLSVTSKGSGPQVEKDDPNDPINQLLRTVDSKKNEQ